MDSKSRKKLRSKRIPYSNASDDEKVSRNWNKARGLFNRGEYSVAIIRCGTCVELTINFAVRQELVNERKLPLAFVNRLLRNANGLRNKYLYVFLAIMEEYEEHDNLKELWKDNVDFINNERNAIVHSGEFRSEPVARSVLEKTYKSLQVIMDLYHHDCEIRQITTEQ